MSYNKDSLFITKMNCGSYKIIYKEKETELRYILLFSSLGKAELKIKEFQELSQQAFDQEIEKNFR